MSLQNMEKTWKEQLLCRVVRYMTLWLWGGFVYYCIELLWRGHSHPSMFIVGGICLVMLGGMNNYLPWRMGFVWQVLIGTLGVLVIEFIAGLIVNIWLDLNVWDYSNLRFNIMGQVSLLFYFLFLPVVAFGIWLDDFLRWKIYGEQKPTYRAF